MYCAQATRFLAFVAKPLVLVRLGDVQADLATLDGPAPATRADATTLKSLFSFAQETGDLRFNLGKVPEAPPVKNTPAERILAESDALLMVRLEPNMSQAECRTSNEGRACSDRAAQGPGERDPIGTGREVASEVPEGLPHAASRNGNTGEAS